MAMSFEEFKERMIKSGKKVTVTTKVLGKVVEKKTYDKGKLTSHEKHDLKEYVRKKHKSSKSNSTNQVQQNNLDIAQPSDRGIVSGLQAQEQLKEQYSDRVRSLGGVRTEVLTKWAKEGKISKDLAMKVIEYKAQKDALTSGYIAANKVQAESRGRVHKDVLIKRMQKAGEKASQSRWDEQSKVYNKAYQDVQLIGVKPIQQTKEPIQPKATKKESETFKGTDIFKPTSKTFQDFVKQNPDFYRTKLPTPNTTSITPSNQFSLPMGQMKKQPTAEIQPYATNKLDAYVKKMHPTSTSFWDTLKSYEQKGLKKITETSMKYSPYLTTTLVEPTIFTLAGAGMGAIEFSKDLGTFAAHPISSTKSFGKSLASLGEKAIEKLNAPLKSFEKAGESVGKYLSTKDLSMIGFDVGKIAGYVGAQTVTLGAAAKGTSKLKDYFAKTKVNIDYKIKKVVPHTKEYRTMSIDTQPISEMKVKLKTEQFPKKYAIVKSEYTKVEPTDFFKAKATTQVDYTLMTKKELNAFLKKSSKLKNVVQPQEYISRTYSIVGYSDDIKLPKYLKTKITTKEINLIGESAAKSPYLQNFDTKIKTLRDVNRKYWSSIKKGVYYERRKVSLTLPSQFDKDIARLKQATKTKLRTAKTKWDYLWKSKRATGQKLIYLQEKPKVINLEPKPKVINIEPKIKSKSVIMLNKPQPIKLGFEGTSKILSKVTTSVKVSGKISRVFGKMGEFITKTKPFVIGSDVVKNLQNQEFNQKFDAFVKTKQKQQLKVDQLQQQKEMQKLKLGTKTIQQMKLESLQLSKLKFKPQLIPLQKVKLNIDQQLKPKVKTSQKPKIDTKTKPTQDIGHLPDIKIPSPFPSTKNTNFSFPSRFGGGFWGSKSKKSKSYKKWLKYNPWSKVKRVRL